MSAGNAGGSLVRRLGRSSKERDMIKIDIEVLLP